MKVSIALVLTLLVFGNGCANLGDVIRAKESGAEGTTRVYPVDADQAWKIAMTVFRWEDADAIEEHRDEGFMLTSSGMDMFSMGTVMGAWVDVIDKNNTKVTVVTKRRVATNIRTTLTEGTFHRRFAQAVEIVKAGKPLPRIAPVETDEQAESPQISTVPPVVVAEVPAKKTESPTKKKEECSIKGAILFTKKIYFKPGDENYSDVTISKERGEKMFCTDEEAKTAGFLRTTK